MTKINLNERPKFGFKYGLTVCDDSTLKAAIEEFFKIKISLEELQLGRYAKEALEVIKFFGPQLGRQSSYVNLVPNFLRYEFARKVAGESITPTFNANYVALGDDATVVAYTDTVLGNETMRATFDARSASFNAAYLDKFFGSSGVGGNSYFEIGIFTDASATPDDGYLFSHVNINEALAITESLTINAIFTVTDS